MLHGFTKFVGAALMLATTPVLANSAAADVNPRGSRVGAELPPYLQCVPYARQVSGIQIYGDAHTWWKQAEGKFARGRTPKVGAVMAFKPHRNMRLGHVAAVSRVIDSRTIELRHSNWSPINGRRGQIEDNVRAIDVSRNNDWSQVRVWYHPIQALGKTPWPIHGFIYNGKGKVATPVSRGHNRTAIAKAAAPKPAVRAETAVKQRSSAAFSNAFGGSFAIPTRQRVAARPQTRTQAATNRGSDEIASLEELSLRRR